MSNFLCPSSLCPISALSKVKMSKTTMSKSMSNYRRRSSFVARRSSLVGSFFKMNLIALSSVVARPSSLVDRRKE